MKFIFALGILKAKRRLPEYARMAGVIKQAHVNGGEYFGGNLTEGRWAFPTETWFSERLKIVRERNAMVQ